MGWQARRQHRDDASLAFSITEQLLPDLAGDDSQRGVYRLALRAVRSKDSWRVSKDGRSV